MTGDDRTQRGVADATEGGVCPKSVLFDGASTNGVAFSRENDIHPDPFESGLNMDAYALSVDADWQHCSWKTFGDLHPSLSFDETFDWDFAEFARTPSSARWCGAGGCGPSQEYGGRGFVDASKAGAEMMGDAAKAGAGMMGDAAKAVRG